MRATSGVFKGLNPTVTVASKILVISFVLFCVLQAEQAGKAFEMVSGILLQNVKWFYLGLLTAILGFLFYLMIGRFAHIRLGKDNEKPEFTFTGWISMLFSGGMGVGLVFWSAAEPMWHYASNPFTPGLSDESASMAMQLTFFHWGLHPWAIFCITALALAYFSYRKGLPFSLRSILYPIIGNRIYGPIGHTVDILTIVITAFGVAQSLSMSVLQINSGLNQVFGFENSLSLQFIMLTILCGIATISVVMGINRGMQRLSELNMILAILLIAILLIIGPTRYLFNTLFEATGNYTQNLISMSLWSDAQKDSGWQNWWTAFYWPWWMTWGPFVGMFIARISRGRTIRELIAGVLIVPTLVTAIWMSVVGGSALKVEQDARHAYEKHAAALVKAGEPAPEPFTGGPIVKATQADNTRALFTMFDNIDSGTLGKALSIITCLLLATFLITSTDCGTHVLCYMDAEGATETPIKIRIVWGSLIAILAGVLLYAGGLKAIQSASIIAGFPIAIFLAIMSVTLFKNLRREPQACMLLPEHARPKNDSLEESPPEKSSLQVMCAEKTGGFNLVN
ncbi:BCCT family transporter [Acinetobacter baumannii]|uniref:BCCT family transporter n=12 Tax=Acinetobacter baumannii TaxID=470 RepID=UPI00254BBA86|nr:BCCT family transporter [Acinetobacter baumannii]MDK6044803.1 BCCT family transporter [Acinetobacter baumannii]MDK6048600.1 BCCT family transporter [Acinetobacter baumannii]MDK6138845.1 BCCT family transporter [Acinetobacter baumannii]MDK6173782.1 BCCT family transporter [Acinetobacter baumannii]MDK6193052.1 BCCT family transporter [Acinetobacter baumannii]